MGFSLYPFDTITLRNPMEYRNASGKGTVCSSRIRNLVSSSFQGFADILIRAPAR